MILQGGKSIILFVGALLLSALNVLEIIDDPNKQRPLTHLQLLLNKMLFCNLFAVLCDSSGTVPCRQEAD